MLRYGPLFGKGAGMRVGIPKEIKPREGRVAAQAVYDADLLIGAVRTVGFRLDDRLEYR